jgi:serine phosphatase RsbU (regulator of sigma subunit)
VLPFAFSLVVCGEGLHVVVRALWQRQDGAWLLGLGFAVFLVTLGYHSLSSLGLLPVELPRQWAYWGLLAVVVSMSTYLAQDFARSSRRRLLVEAENERRGHELGLASSLQLSMLPQEYPALPHLELGWRMQPASEVGGDYYDYHLAADGALTLALGDATGHGMQAGILVAAVKGLFQALARQPDLAAILEIISASLRRMHLGRLGMALVLLRIEGLRATVAAAGMPPLWRLRGADNRFEEILIPGVPLGLSDKGRYTRQELTLEPGDTLLLMSDGLPERGSPAGVELGYPAAEQLFRACAGQTASAICDSLLQGGDRWAGGIPPTDDTTFVVVKVKPQIPAH